MLKQTITYTDFNDDEATETLYFNITKTELSDQLHLKDQLEELEKSFEGPKRGLTVDEVRTILDLVKMFMKMSYGVRSADGKRFIKADDQWIEFTQTAAYDAFLFSLFEDPQKAFGFLIGIMPKELRGDAEAAARAKQPELFAGVTADDVQSVVNSRDEDGPTNVPIEGAILGNHGQDDDRPAWIRENRDPTRAEVHNMSYTDLQAEFVRKIQG